MRNNKRRPELPLRTPLSALVTVRNIKKCPNRSRLITPDTFAKIHLMWKPYHIFSRRSIKSGLLIESFMVQSFNVIKTSEWLCSSITEKSSGTVQSVYEHAINIWYKNRLFALQPSGSPASPVSMILPIPAGDFGDLPIREGDPVQITPGSPAVIRISTAVRITLSDSTETYASALAPVPDRERLAEDAELARRITGRSTAQLLFSPTAAESGDDLLQTAAVRTVQEALRLLSSGGIRQSADKFASLTGLGIGLTPSGDDFLCGLLASLMARGLWEAPFSLHLRRAIRQSERCTNPISATFLDCALAGQFSEAVIFFFQGENAADREHEAESRFAAIGHTSGMDTLCGIYLGLRLVFPTRTGGSGQFGV